MRGLIEDLPNPYPLMDALPAVYHDDPMAARLTAAFDDALAPVISTLDNLDAYFDPALAPLDVVNWVASWVGFPLGETWPEDRSRALVAQAVELFKWRGTVRGLRTLLEAYAGVTVEVFEPGGVSYSTTPGASPPGQPTTPRRRAKGQPKADPRKGPAADPDRPAEPPAYELVVRVRRRGSATIDERQVDALIRASKPAHIPYRLEVVP